MRVKNIYIKIIICSSHIVFVLKHVQRYSFDAIIITTVAILITTTIIIVIIAAASFRN